MGKFQEGDKVISITDTNDVPEGFIGFVVEVGNPCFEYTVISKDGKSELFHEDELELLTLRKDFNPTLSEIEDYEFPDTVTPKDIQGIAKPILEERKSGKVKMQLFDEGFPNAVLEVAKVMTWAEQNKGYSPHDWKKLPNADTEFSAAASRHKLKAFVQKVEGIPAIDRTDEESHIVHLAHVAFNVLAELELVLTGKIK